MVQLNENELMNISGGGIDVDINKLVVQINPLKWFYDFGHDVVYPYIYKPLFG